MLDKTGEAPPLLMAMVKGALKRLDMIRTMPELKEKLWQNTNALQSGLRNAGFDLGTTQTCITPVFLKGDIPEAMAMVNDLRENHGIFCSIVVYPVIPKGLIILRLIPTASHTQEDIDETITAFSAIREKLENGTYKRIAAPGEFRANIHLGGSAEKIIVSKQIRSLAIKACKSLNLEVAGVDIINSSRGPLVLEVNSSPGLEGIETVSQRDIASLLIKHIEKKLKFRRSSIKIA